MILEMQRSVNNHIVVDCGKYDPSVELMRVAGKKERAYLLCSELKNAVHDLICKTLIDGRVPVTCDATHYFSSPFRGQRAYISSSIDFNQGLLEKSRSMPSKL